MKRKFLRISLGALIALSLVAAGCGQKPATKQTSGNTTATTKAAETKETPKFVPKQAVSMYTPAVAGGTTDMLARAVEKVWSKYVNQPLVIVNKGGGGGLEAATFVSRSKPDGYTTIIGYGSGHDLVMPHLQKIDYDPFTSVTPVARVSVHSIAILAQYNSQFNSIKDVIAWAKKENKPVTCSVSNAAGALDLTAQGMGKLTGVPFTAVPHSGSAQAITTLLGGNTTIGTGHPSEVLMHLKTQKLKPIAITTAQRDPILPDVPTLHEQGINFDCVGSVKGLALPANTPPEIVAYYEDLFKKITDDADFKKIMTDMGQPVLYQGSKEFTKWMKEAFEQYGKLVKDLGLEKK
jgi:tripartite-type tricarboxylate transporter receptor subunit TctC